MLAVLQPAQQPCGWETTIGLYYVLVSLAATLKKFFHLKTVCIQMNIILQLLCIVVVSSS